MSKLDVAILMGSDSDYPQVEGAVKVFKEFGVSCEVRVLSAHRTPDALHEYLREAENRGVGVFIGAAGGAAHLPGVIASQTTLPVLGIPIQTSSFGGNDSLLSIVQMPGGIPVATFAVGKAGAKNAALFAIQILGFRAPELQEKMKAYREKMKSDVAAKDKALQDKLKA